MLPNGTARKRSIGADSERSIMIGPFHQAHTVIAVQRLIFCCQHTKADVALLLQYAFPRPLCCTYGPVPWFDVSPVHLSQRTSTMHCTSWVPRIFLVCSELVLSLCDFCCGLGYSYFIVTCMSYVGQGRDLVVLPCSCMQICSL